jgi:hypothetical protein
MIAWAGIENATIQRYTALDVDILPEWSLESLNNSKYLLSNIDL